jgi:hypothetical protein
MKFPPIIGLEFVAEPVPLAELAVPVVLAELLALLPGPVEELLPELLLLDELLFEPVPLAELLVPVLLAELLALLPGPVDDELLFPAHTYVREAQTALYWLFAGVKFGTITAWRPVRVIVTLPVDPMPAVLPVPVVFVVAPVLLVLLPVPELLLEVEPLLPVLEPLVPDEDRSLCIHSCMDVKLPDWACCSSTT